MKNTNIIEVFYTGGGIWIAENYLDEYGMTYAVVSSEAPEYLTIYRENEEKHLPEDMILSMCAENMSLEYKILHDRMLSKLETLID